MQELSYTSPDGLNIVRYMWEPKSPKAILMVAHGLAEHAMRYARLAERFAEAGWLVHAHDQRGHGKSVDNDHPHGHFADHDGFNRAVEDIARMSTELRERGLPIVLLGHSAGSFMTQQLLFEHPGSADAFVLSGSDGKPPPLVYAGRGVLRLERRRVGRRGTSAVFQRLSFGEYNRGFEGRTEYDWLSRDPAEVDKYVADPLCGFAMTTQSWLDLLNALVHIGRPRNQRRIPPDKPIYLFGGDQDPVGRKGKGVKLLAQAYRDAGIRDLTTKLYSGARHETLNETNRDEVMSDLLQWCEQHLP